MHLFGKVVATNVSGYLSISLGAFHLKLPTGGSAKGIPTNEIVFFPPFSFSIEAIYYVFLTLNV